MSFVSSPHSPTGAHALGDRGRGGGGVEGRGDGRHFRLTAINPLTRSLFRIHILSTVSIAVRNLMLNLICFRHTR